MEVIDELAAEQPAGKSLWPVFFGPVYGVDRRGYRLVAIPTQDLHRERFSYSFTCSTSDRSLSLCVPSR